jgi:LysR family glycine cleavage system transcriptional activator
VVVLLRHEFISDLAYYLIVPEHKVDDPVLALFRDWIETEAARYRAASGAD